MTTRRHLPHLPCVLLLGAALVCVCPALADEPAELAVQKLKVRFTRAGATLKLRLALPLDPVLDTLDVDSDVVAIRLNDVTVFALPDASVRKPLREKKALLWKYRTGRRGPRLSLDLAFREVKLVARRVDLGTALDEPEQGVTVALDLGERTFQTVVDVDARGRVLKLRPPASPPGQPPVDPGDPGGGGNPTPVAGTVLDQTWTSGITAPENAVARTESEWAVLWAQHQAGVSPTPARPNVDFSQNMVIGVFLGNRPNPSHSVEIGKLLSDGATTTVEFKDVRLVDSQAGACFFPAVVAQPAVLVRVPRTARVTFSGRIVKRPCP